MTSIAEALSTRGLWLSSGEVPGRETLSWLVVAAMLEDGKDLGVVETHPGPPGEYDCLSVYDRTRLDRGPILDLDRNGTAHIAPLDGGADHWDGVWDFCATEGPVAVANQIWMRAGLGEPMSHRGLEAATAAQIARRLLKLHTAEIAGVWECRNGVADSSTGSERRMELFQQLPAGVERLAAAPAHPLGDPAYGFWFLMRDGVPVSCIDIFR